MNEGNFINIRAVGGVFKDDNKQNIYWDKKLDLS